MNCKIIGEPLPVAICRVAAGETIITESGAMSWMSSNMKMETTSNGGIGKVFGRAFSGENLFQNKYTAMNGEGEIAFGAKMAGSIIEYPITPGHSLIVQKSAFLACTEGVELSLHFRKKLGSGFFGGEGFIMQKISGNGTALIEIDGHAIEYTLAAGEEMIIDTGYLAFMDESCTMDIQTVPGIKNMFLGGEGIFNTIIKGPGKVTLQSMPVMNLAKTLIPYMPVSSK